MKTLAIVYEEPPEQVFINAASRFGVTPAVAKAMFAQMLVDAQPTISLGQEPEPLALNRRAIDTMCAIEGTRSVKTRWLGVRYPQKSEVVRGGFLTGPAY